MTADMTEKGPEDNESPTRGAVLQAQGLAHLQGGVHLLHPPPLHPPLLRGHPAVCVSIDVETEVTGMGHMPKDTPLIAEALIEEEYT